MIAVLAAGMALASLQVFEADAKANPPDPIETTADCPIPAVKAGSRLLIAGVYEGAAVSALAVGGIDDETNVADVAIEPGREPLTLVLTSYSPIIYRFSGATGRVANLILLHSDGAAVSGLPRSRVSFASAADCDLPYSIYKGPKALFAPRIRALFGRNADFQGGVSSLYRAQVGSNGFRFIDEPKATWQGANRFEQEMARFYPAGVATVHPRKLVSSGPVEPYPVLPSTAGIVQLLMEGAVVEGTARDIDKWLVTAAGRRRYSTATLASARERLMHNVVMVRRPINVPVGLCGAHSVTFIAPNPSYLRGSRCHSTVLFADGSADSSSFPD